jgi:spermidine synthase
VAALSNSHWLDKHRRRCADPRSPARTLGPVDHVPGADAPVVVERFATPRGELVLRSAGSHFEVISNGTFLMDTRDGRSERLLVRAATDLVGAPGRVLIGGLGVGFSLLEALADPRVGRVTVVEIEPDLLEWHRHHLRHLTGDALDDPRVEVLVGDLADHLGDAAHPAYDVICLDVDNGPEWTVTHTNAALYDVGGTRLLVSRLRPGGALAVWSAHEAPTYEALLRTELADVRVHHVDVRGRGDSDVVYVGRSTVGPSG